MTAPLLRTPLSLLRALAAGTDPVGYFRRHAARPEPLRLLFPGLGEVVFFGTEAAARDLFTIPPAICRAPTPNPVEAVVGPGSLILLSGAEHRRERGLLLPAFHSDRVRHYAGIICSATEDEIRPLRTGDTIDVHRLAVEITLHIAIRVVFGVDDCRRRAEYTRAVVALMRANTAPLMLIPALRHPLGGYGPWARLMKMREHLDELLSSDMAERTRSGSSGADMLDILLSATDESGLRHSDAEMRDQLRTLLAAGHETTATALAWALYRIYRDDHILDRLSDELSDNPDPGTADTLPYLGAVIKETLRMHPPVPIVLRRLTEPRSIDGTDCQAGQVAGIALYGLHFNPEIWEDPGTFEPQRFLDRRVSPFEYAPFGGGHRRCIGAGFASSELAFAIATIMTELDLRMPADARSRPEPRSVTRGIAVAPARDITLEVVGVR